MIIDALFFASNSIIPELNNYLIMLVNNELIEN